MGENKIQNGHYLCEEVINMAITIEDILESERYKREACESCKDALKEHLTPDALAQFDKIFYSAAQGYLFRRKES